MSESIKLNDNKYVDASGVYDSDRGMLQNSINYNALRPFAHAEAIYLQNKDLNDCKDEHKCYYADFGALPTVSNPPTTSTAYTVFVIATIFGYSQVAFDYNSTTLWMRVEYNGSWTAWRTI